MIFVKYIGVKKTQKMDDEEVDETWAYAGIPATTSSPLNKLCSYSSLTDRKIFMVVRASST
jgi:hypothetical protein